jgi:hypothetical protein
MTRCGALKVMRKPLHCCVCDDVIGVYEPLIALVNGSARTTSRAAEPGLPGAAAPYYHEACYVAYEDRRAAPVSRVAGGSQ